MRMIVRKIIAMAYDERISDKHFRAALQKLTNPSVVRKGVTKVMDELHEQAILDTEYDELVH